MHTIPETNGHRKVNHKAQYAAAHRAAYPWYRAHLGAYAGVVRQPWADGPTVEFQRDSDGKSVFVRRDHPELVLAGYIDPREPLPTDQKLVRTCSQTTQAASVVETPAPAAVAAPMSRTAQVGLFLAQGLEQASRTGDAKLARRVSDAAWIVLQGAVTLQADGTALVRSQRDSEVVYRVRGRTCECKDWEKNPTRCCKHTLATVMEQRLAA